MGETADNTIEESHEDRLNTTENNENNIAIAQQQPCRQKSEVNYTRHGDRILVRRWQ